MVATASVVFPFKGSDNIQYNGQTLPIDANGAVPMSLTTVPLATGAATLSLQQTINTTLTNIQTAVSGPTPAGTSIIGKVGIDQTTPGTTNKVSIGTDGTVAITSSVLPTGAASQSLQTAGNQSLASILQNTGVQLPLVASTAVIGKVTIDQTTPGTTNKVSIGSDGTVAISNFASSGLATAAKQPALGVAGTPSLDVLTVQGSASGTPIKVDASATTQLTQLADGTTTTKATVKAGSANVTGTDTALVVAIHPNSVNANGQALMAASAPVVIASNQSPLAVTLAGTGPQLTTASTSVTFASNQGNIPVSISTLGQAQMSASVPVALASDTGTLTIGGDVASGTVDSGKPVKFGGIALTANPTVVSSLSRVNAMFDKVGKQITVGAIRTLKNSSFTTLTATTETTIITAGGANVFNDVYGLIITNSTASIATITIRNATAGSVIAVYNVPANGTAGFMLPVDSAVNQTTANGNWTGTASVANALSVSAFYVINV